MTPSLPRFHLAASRSRKTLQSLLVGIVLAASTAPNTVNSFELSLTVPYAAGGPSDLVARHLAEALQKTIVINKPGAGNAKLTGPNKYKDRSDLLLGDVSTILRVCNAGGGNDSLKELRPLTLVATSRLAFIVNKQEKITSISEFVNISKSNERKLLIATTGFGSPPKLAAEMLQIAASIRLIDVPYRGAAPALVDVLAARVTSMFLGLSLALPQFQHGDINILAVTGHSRHAALGNIPTFQEVGLDMGPLSSGTWWGLFISKDDQNARRIDEILQNAIQSDSFKKKMSVHFFETPHTTTHEFEEFIARQENAWKMHCAAIKYNSLDPE